MALTKISTDGVKDDAITKAKIPADQIESSELATGCINNSNLFSGAVVNTAQIVNNAVTTNEIADEAVTLAKLPHGDASNNGKFLRANNGADPTFETVSTDLVADTSPELGGHLDLNSNNLIGTGEIDLTDASKIKLGTGDDLQIYHDGNANNSYVSHDNGSGHLYLQGDAIKLRTRGATNNEVYINCNHNAQVELYHNNVKQLETHESGIILPKAVVRGMGGSKAILGGVIDPSQDKSWNFSFSTNAHGYNNGYVFSIKFFMNHWNSGDYFKYIEALRGGRGNVTSFVGHTAVENLGAGGSNWNNGHLDYEVSLSGGTMNGAGAALFKVKYDADGAPAWTSGYYLEVGHSGQIGQITIT